MRRLAYLCKHETACLVGTGVETRRTIKIVTGRDVYVGEYEDIKKSDRINSAGRALCVERNPWIVDEDSVSLIHLNRKMEKGGWNNACL